MLAARFVLSSDCESWLSCHIPSLAANNANRCGYDGPEYREEKPNLKRVVIRADEVASLYAAGIKIHHAGEEDTKRRKAGYYGYAAEVDVHYFTPQEACISTEARTTAAKITRAKNDPPITIVSIFLSRKFIFLRNSSGTEYQQERR